ncbi:MAG TPA: type II toxin-antitoxin system PemK/MazF family toxin [Propionibacteriaceae bacterium]|nr:type II toxin-antitoxin system PemK/MazF family toxin [Propionibacteriaceae bacterium]
MRRGEIWLTDLEPIRGAEASKRHPAVIVSNDQANRRAEQLGRGVVTVVPVTSNVSRVLPFQVLLIENGTGLGVPSKAQAEQVRSVDVSRLTTRLGQVPPAAVSDLDAALRLHLNL